MDLQQIRYFLTVAEKQNFSQAADECGVRQPSVSNAIRRLESELGGELFLRSRPVQLSNLGAALLPIFVQINDLARKTQTVAGSYSRRRGMATLGNALVNSVYTHTPTQRQRS